MEGINGVFSSISSLLDNIFSGLETASSSLIGFSTTLAGIGCIIYIASIILPAIERGERIYLYPLLKPIFVAIVVTNFGALAGGLNSVSTSFGKTMSNIVTSDDSAAYFKLFADKANQMCETELLAKDAENQSAESVSGIGSSESGGSGPQVSSKSIKWFRQLASTFFYKWLIPALAWLAQMLGQLFYIALLFYSKFVLLVLTLVGPLSFALSQFKVLSGSFAQWLARFISISLYPGLCGLVRGVVDQIARAIAENMQLTVSGVIISILLLIFSATLYLHVPTLADFVVQSGGAGNIGGIAKRAGRSVLNKIKGQ